MLGVFHDFDLLNINLLLMRPDSYEVDLINLVYLVVFQAAELLVEAGVEKGLDRHDALLEQIRVE